MLPAAWNTHSAVKRQGQEVPREGDCWQRGGPGPREQSCLEARWLKRWGGDSWLLSHGRHAEVNGECLLTFFLKYKIE